MRGKKFGKQVPIGLNWANKKRREKIMVDKLLTGCFILSCYASSKEVMICFVAIFGFIFGLLFFIVEKMHSFFIEFPVYFGVILLIIISVHTVYKEIVE